VSISDVLIGQTEDRLRAHGERLEAVAELGVRDDAVAIPVKVIDDGVNVPPLCLNSPEE